MDKERFTVRGKGSEPAAQAVALCSPALPPPTHVGMKKKGAKAGETAGGRVHPSR